MPKEKFSVEAETGRDGEPEPRAVVVNGEHHEVVGISDRWHDEKATYFTVKIGSGNTT